MALIENWLAPSRENWEFIVWIWQFFPLVTILQWSPTVNHNMYTMGKTSSNSRFNLPGRIAWITMEVPGPLTLIYTVISVSKSTNLSEIPWENMVLASFYVLHYLNRAIIAPLIAPSISPISPHVWASAAIFQFCNGLALGGWLGGYGPRSRAEWQVEANYKAGGRIELGMMIFFLGLIGNIWHDDELREIRRAASRNQKRLQAQRDEDSKGGAKGVEKVYMIPQNGLFVWILYPHYLLEWIEWAGFYIMCGLGCVPARNFLINEVATMLPRAVSGKQWYVERFGKEKVAGRKAIIPGLL